MVIADQATPKPASLDAFSRLSPEQQLEVLRIKKARQHSYHFNEYCFVDPQGKPWTQQSFHWEWHEATEIYNHVQIEAFRESAKTEQISIGKVLWRLGKNPNLRVKVVSAGDSLAKAIIGAAGKHIEGNERMHRVFPQLVPADKAEWNMERLFVKRSLVLKDASLSAHGVLSSGVGGRCDVLIFDDVCDYRNTVLQPALKNLVRQAVEQVWLKLVTPGGQVIWIDTPWAPDDASAMVAGWQDYHHIRHPIHKKVRSKSTGEVFETSRWPEKYSNEWLANEERQRPLSFKTQYRLERSGALGETFFPEAIILGSHSFDVPTLGDPEPGRIYVSFWDLGRHATKKGRNATVCVTIDITEYPAYIRHIRSYLNVPYDSPNPDDYCVANEIVRINNLYRGETVVESNAAGEAISEGLPISVSLFTTTSSSKHPMLQNLLNTMSAGDLKWRPTDNPDIIEMENQLKSYTLQDDNIAQDFVIALAGASLFVGSAGGSGIVI